MQERNRAGQDGEGLAAANVASPLGEVTELIVHDPGYRPFIKRPANDCLRASWWFHRKESFHLIFATEQPVLRHADQCLTRISQSDADAWNTYFEVADEPRPERRTDYRISLLTREDVLKTFGSPSYEYRWTLRQYQSGKMKEEERRSFAPARVRGPTSFWSVLVHRGLPGTRP